MEPDERSLDPQKSATDAALWERALGPFLEATTEEAADRQLDYLMREFVTPLVTSTLARELRRGPSNSLSRIWADTETFREIQAKVEGQLVSRLRQLRPSEAQVNPPARPIQDFRAYVIASSRHACSDYLRERRPGRHALDTALRVALDTVAEFALWKHKIRTDFFEWRCGYAAWKTAGLHPISLRNDPDLLSRLSRRIREENGTRAEVLRIIFDLVKAPLLYTDLLDFLAALWDVEAPYRAAAMEYSPLRVQTPAVHVEDPASVALRMGTLQEIWKRLQPLSSEQKAALLLRLPPVDGRNFLEEFIRFNIVEEAEFAAAIGLTPEELRFQYPLLPLEDVAIADLLKVSPEDIRRIRQDARRRLQRQRPE